MTYAHLNIEIRKEEDRDAPDIRGVLLEAFDEPLEANLVEKLRESGAFVLSMVALLDGEVVGHIIFTPVSFEPGIETISAVGLGPMAVLPVHQRKGIGSRMVEESLVLLKDAGHHLAVVLGHAEYYPRFGFSPAANFGVRCEFEVPDEAFMIMELREGALKGVSGTVRYRPEFREV